MTDASVFAIHPRIEGPMGVARERSRVDSPVTPSSHHEAGTMGHRSGTAPRMRHGRAHTERSVSASRSGGGGDATATHTGVEALAVLLRPW